MLILKLDRLTATNMLHKEIIVLKVTHIGESSVLGFVNKVLCGHCPDIFLSYYTIKRNAFDVRKKGQLVTAHTRIQIGDRAVKVKECLLRNRIDKKMLEYRLSKSSCEILQIYVLRAKNIRKGQWFEISYGILFISTAHFIFCILYFSYFNCNFICTFVSHYFNSHLLRSGLPHEYVNFQATSSVSPWASLVVSDSNK